MSGLPIVSATKSGLLAAFSVASTCVGSVQATDRIIVLDSGEAHLPLIDQATRQAVGTEPTINRADSTIGVVDYNTLTRVSEITGLMPGPDDMELSADRRYLWVTFRFARHVGVIDTATHKLVQTIAAARSPHGLYFAERAPVVAPNPD